MLRYVSLVVAGIMSIAVGASHSQEQQLPLEKLTPVFPVNAALPAILLPGKIRVWAFLSARCPCSHSHIEKLKRTYAEFSPLGVEFVAVHANQDEPENEGEKYFSQQKLGFSVFRDHGAKLANHLGALKTPHVFVEAGPRRILFEGGLDTTKKGDKNEENMLRDALLEIRAGKPVSRPVIRTLGCMISRRSPS